MVPPLFCLNNGMLNRYSVKSLNQYLELFFIIIWKHDNCIMREFSKLPIHLNEVLV